MVCHFDATLKLVELIILAAFLATSIICAFAVFEEYKEGKTYFNIVEKPVTPDDLPTTTICVTSSRKLLYDQDFKIYQILTSQSWLLELKQMNLKPTDKFT